MKLNTLYLMVGVVGFLVFATTGQVMIHQYQVENLTAEPRLLIRSAHLYLMLVSAINLALGLFGKFSGSKIDYLVAVIVMSSPVLMTLEFFLGTREIDQQRPYAYYSLIAIFAVFAAIVAIRWVAAIFQKMRS